MWLHNLPCVVLHIYVCRESRVSRGREPCIISLGKVRDQALNEQTIEAYGIPSYIYTLTVLYTRRYDDIGLSTGRRTILRL